MRTAKAKTPTLEASAYYFFRNLKVPYTHIQVTSIEVTGAFGSGDKINAVYGVDEDGDILGPLLNMSDVRTFPLDTATNRILTFNKFQGAGILVEYVNATGSALDATIKASFYTLPGTNDYVRTKEGYPAAGPAPSAATFAAHSSGVGGYGNLTHGGVTHPSNSVDVTSVW